MAHNEELCNPPAQLGASPSDKAPRAQRFGLFFSLNMEGKEPCRGQGSKGEPSTRNTETHKDISASPQPGAEGEKFPEEISMKKMKLFFC